MTNNKCELTSMDVDVRHPIMHSMPPSTNLHPIFSYVYPTYDKLQENSKLACWSQTNPFLAFDFPYLIFEGWIFTSWKCLENIGPRAQWPLWGGLFSSIFVNINIMVWSNSLPLIAKEPSYSPCRICFGRPMHLSSYYYACRISLGGGICHRGRFRSTNEGK